MPDSGLFYLWIPIALAAAAAGGLAWRRRRVRRWARLLAAPTAEALRELRRPPASEPLPAGDKLFDYLYRQHRSEMPRSRDSLILALAAAQVRDAPAPPSPVDAEAVRPPALSTEDKVKSLLVASADPGALLPAEAFAENALINLVNVLRGKKQLRLGLEHALLDSLGAAGGLAGSKVGGVMGLLSVSWLAGLALPFVAALVPLSILVGGALGALAGKRAGGWFKGWRYLIAAQRVRGACRGFQRWLIAQFPRFLQTRQEEFRRAILQTRSLRARHRSRPMRWLRPDLKSAFLDQCLRQLERDGREERRRLQALRTQLRTMDPLRLAGLLEELGRQGAQLDPAAQREDPALWAHARAYAAAATQLRQLQASVEKRRDTDRQSA